MKIERLISRFDKSTEELLEEKNMDNINLEILKTIFKPNHEGLINVQSLYNHK